MWLILLGHIFFADVSKKIYNILSW